MNQKWYETAQNLIGTSEIKGPVHNNKITAWLRDLNAWWHDDETPWCGTFVAHCMKVSGFEIPGRWYRAKSWCDYGFEITEPLPIGTILVFNRDGGGHVGFYAGESETHYLVLGGNQKDDVNICEYCKSSCIARRWPFPFE